MRGLPHIGLWQVATLAIIFNRDSQDQRSWTIKTRTELEAAVYRRLVEHLRQRTDVQNIDLMNLAGFCRNCLSNWMKDAADAKGLAMTKDESREIVYGDALRSMAHEVSEGSHLRTEGGVRQSGAQALTDAPSVAICGCGR